MFSKESIKLARATVGAIKKISKGKWEWKPKIGTWCLINPNIIKEPQLIVKVDSEALNPIQTHQGYGFTYPDPYPKVLHLNTIIPLLHWEDHLEPILKKLGWDLWDMKRTVPSSDGTGSLVVVELTKGKSLKCGQGKDRQEAFQRAVIWAGEKK